MQVLTNNPLVVQKLQGQEGISVGFHSVPLRGLMVLARDRVHAGHRLLTHPLSGSVKPNETPYKSIALSDRPQQGVCVDSLMLIEQAIAACDRFTARYIEPTPQMDEDFQLVDWTLMQSALHSADACK